MNQDKLTPKDISDFVSTVYQMKREMEGEIAAIITRFQEKTGLMPDVQVDWIDVSTFSQHQAVVKVTSEVKL